MRALLFLSIPALFLFSACSSDQERFVPLQHISAAPVSYAAWGRMVGNYSGPVRSRIKTWMGTTGERSESVNLSVRGTPLHPEVYMRVRTDYSTAWTGLGSRMDNYTNIPRMEYGSDKLIGVSTHSPNILVVEVPKNIYVLRFVCRNRVEVDEIGIHGWRGSGRFYQVPEYPCPELANDP